MADATTATKPRRVAQIIRLKPEKLDEYRKLHAAVWPEVLGRIAASNIRNYTIFYSRETEMLFANFEYVGTDWDADMAAIAADESTRRWWEITDPCQESIAADPASGSADAAASGKAWWAVAEEVFHTD
ncbi:hypothetical protein FNF29_04906 [Cafeteria roenbergensis]|uniref:L-rhamnose mutarotase n=1 Tax=Cafeteria roenbergensis TaxID=33653 RepID=A0A5A8CJJ6_CAFRO|nr:hypothetical protein FNF29_04906 [Cafeteria roenbergensis]KAA0152664.1 hypothetical protein FNF31_06606 [Cafeteria roenbergensis]KAA0160014.1 hypothetical protein FNF28_05594 [Cafeteria roenbergensis]|eukprot:KAA0151016.1 hypothetical protein FNF29_04906 [Cafeteria roenbergensis]